MARFFASVLLLSLTSLLVYMMVTRTSMAGRSAPKYYPATPEAQRQVAIRAEMMAAAKKQQELAGPKQD
jgi:hypothetical protein